MTDLQIEELLYTETVFTTENYLIDSWFDRESGEKHIDVVNRHTHEETGFVVNGISVDEVRNRLTNLIAHKTYQ